ncbi:hypothetical protein [Vreelandella aquamarina]|uniref:Uncharacterized protein n=1 Tax=Vreelandella aquamarina TaxID=77097 RepID=A0A6F8SUI6_9GAMM|nr:hypothetical protein [Halomonas meridiana]BCA91921.1 hypothetical protein HMSLTHF_16960 [Halomonas meridiana]
MALGILGAKGGAISGTVAAPAPSQPLAMAVDPVVSSFGLELPSSLLNRFAGLRSANTTLDAQLWCPGWFVARLARMVMDG